VSRPAARASACRTAPGRRRCDGCTSYPRRAGSGKSGGDCYFLRFVPTLDIGKPRSTPLRVEVPLSVEGGSLPALWYEISPGTPGRFSALDGSFALIALLPFAMAKGYDIALAEPVSTSMLANLEEWQDAWLRLRPDLYSRVEIRARLAARRLRRSRSNDAVLAFSGGLDSCYSLSAHANRTLGYRSRRLGLAVIVHGMDIPIEEPSAFAVALASAKRITGSFGIPLCAVSTNWKLFSPDYEATFLAGLASVLHLFSGGFRSCVVSSEDPYGQEIVGWGSHSSTNHLLGHASFPLSTTGLGLARTEKAAAIASDTAITRNLRVCWAGPMNGRNCGECEKCVRTALIFLALGVSQIEAMEPVSLEKLDRLSVANAVQLAYLVDILRYPGVLPEPYRSKLEAVVSAESERLGLPGFQSQRAHA
jgi:hypothetical protein